MRIISIKLLKQFWTIHPRAEEALKAWHSEAKAASWATPADIKKQYGTASILRDGRVVFNIAGNKFRLVAWINYEYWIVYVRFVGTHVEYDKINADTV
ncbi:MAG: mRNA interferase HigB [Planctomycetota bacterium]|jgi:mRNA interferase HigB